MCCVFLRRATRLLGVAVLLTPALLWAANPAQTASLAQRPKTGAAKTARPRPAPPIEIEMFAGIAAGDIAVKFIPRNEHEANVIFTNRTAKPLSVRLPEAFAGVPVAAQFRGGNNNGGFAQASGNQQSPQTVGSGFPTGNSNQGNPFGNNNGNNQRQGNGIFNLPAEKTIQIKVASVCLEHGKPKPKATIAYEIRPLDTVSDKPAVRELLKSLVAGQTSTDVAQAVAWHLANSLSWDELAAKRIEHLSGPNEPYFTSRQLREAKALCAQVEKSAKAAPPTQVLSASTAAQAAK